MSDFNSVLYSIIGQKIKDRREELNYSQQQFAEAVSEVYELKRSSISNIERGRQQAPLHVLYEFCNILKLDLQSILPTYSEVSSMVVKEPEPAIEQFLKTIVMDDKTREYINNLLLNIKK